MSSLVIYAWEKKKRTLLRNIKPGDIFCFALGGIYRFGRIMTRNRFGHVAEIFQATSSSPALPELNFGTRIGRPVILDSYGLFDKKIEGDWRIIAHQQAYEPRSDEAMKRFALPLVEADLAKKWIYLIMTKTLQRVMQRNFLNILQWVSRA